MWISAVLLEETGDLKVEIHLYMNSQAYWGISAKKAEKYDE